MPNIIVMSQLVRDGQREELEKLANFCGLDSIAYEDKGNKEIYTLEKDGKQLKLEACGNKYDGGFLIVNYGQQPKRIVHT